MKRFLLVIPGPTAAGKTKAAIHIAGAFGAEIISADSRQFYRELKIGVAAPSPEELQAVRHHFVGHLSVVDNYNVSAFEQDVLAFLHTYFENKQVAVMVGGSGLYIDAVCKGIDQLPDPDEALRLSLKEDLRVKGMEYLRERLEALDPDYFAVVDLNNPNRILRALEVCITTGNTYSSMRKNEASPRDFEIIKIGLNRPRRELVDIIHRRVDSMLEMGLLDEVKGLREFREANALNTVGYKEIFNYLEGLWTFDLAVEKIKTNTRRYAKRQMTWFNRDREISWFHPDDLDEIKAFITAKTGIASLENSL